MYLARSLRLLLLALFAGYIFLIVLNIPVIVHRIERPDIVFGSMPITHIYWAAKRFLAVFYLLALTCTAFFGLYLSNKKMLIIYGILSIILIVGSIKMPERIEAKHPHVAIVHLALMLLTGLQEYLHFRHFSKRPMVIKKLYRRNAKARPNKA